MTKSKKHKQQLSEQLGMPVSTAERKLRKSIVYEFSKQLGKNICVECSLPISDPEDFAVVHVEEWETASDFFNLKNVAFSHVSCKARHHGKRQGEDMKKLEIKVEDQNGNPLRGCFHKGQLYVAGKQNQAYQITVKNKTSKRLLVVLTVDGRNVLDGKPGNVDGAGHILSAKGSYTFKGWRENQNTVAEFVLGKKKDSYSSQMGSPENVGVIGVAVFDEKEPEPYFKTVIERTVHIWPPVAIPPVTTIPVLPHSDPYWGGNQWNSGGWSSGGWSSGGIYGASPSGTAPCSYTTGSLPPTNCSANLDITVGQDLGTEFGKSLKSNVTYAPFKRASDAPVEVHTLRYDSLDTLVKAGIMRKEKPQKAPQAFPASPEVQGRHCTPPARRRRV